MSAIHSITDFSPDLGWAAQSASQDRFGQLLLASASSSSPHLYPHSPHPPHPCHLNPHCHRHRHKPQVGAARLAVQGNRQPGATHILSGEELLLKLTAIFVEIFDNRIVLMRRSKQAEYIQPTIFVTLKRLSKRTQVAFWKGCFRVELIKRHFILGIWRHKYAHKSALASCFVWPVCSE